MTVTRIVKDPRALTMTLDAEFRAPVGRVWEMWANPRHLERWWGPPTFPATVVEHNWTPGGRVTYFMTGPEGDRFHGWWTITEIDPPTNLSFIDGFADNNGEINHALPTTETAVTLSGDDTTTRMTVVSKFASIEAMEKVLSMGMEEGITSAMNQIDALLPV